MKTKKVGKSWQNKAWKTYAGLEMQCHPTVKDGDAKTNSEITDEDW